MLALLSNGVMSEVFASLGSNREREINITSAVASISRCFGPLICSKVYRSKAVGFAGNDFFNMVLSFQTEAGPLQVREVFRRIEAEHGRTRQEKKFAPRTLDIDLILYDDQVIDEEQLRLPHTDILEYAFVLRPLSEIAPRLLHPLTQRSYEQMWREYRGTRELRSMDLILSDTN